MNSRTPTPLELLMHPVVLASLGLWALNDHVFKPWFANAWTGKLSDVAGLVVVPVLLPAVWEWCTGRTDRRALIGCAVGAALVMTAINVWEPAARMYEIGLGAVQWPFRSLFALVTGGGLAPLREVALTRDPTDLLTLPAAAIPLLLTQREEAESLTWLARGRQRRRGARCLTSMAREPGGGAR